MDRAGLSGDDGPTHHGLFDIGYLRHIPIGCTCSRRMKMNSSICSGQWRTTTPVPSLFVTQGGPVRERKIKSEPKLLEIGKAEVVQHGRTWRSLAWATCLKWPRKRRVNWKRKGISVALINPRLDQTDGYRHTRIFRAQRRSRGARSRITFCTTVWLRGHGTSAFANDHTPVVRIGWPINSFEHGNIPALRKKPGSRRRIGGKSLPLLRRNPTPAIGA